MGVKFDYILGALRLKDSSSTGDFVTQEELDQEIFDRIAADDAEATVRSDDDDYLEGLIVSEAASRLSADNVLQGNIDDEEVARIAADSSEASTRASADTTLQNNINTEASTRAANDTALGNRTTILENNEFKILYYESISSTSGTVTIPTNATILLNDFPQGIDAVIETIVNGEPSGLSAYTSGGTAITISSFDTSGNYILSGIPSAYPVAILFVLKTKGINYQYLTIDNIIEAQTTNGATVAYVDSLTKFPGTGDRMVEVNTSGTPSASKAIVDAYVTDSTLITALTTSANWAGASGSSIATFSSTDTEDSAGYQGQFYIGAIGSIPYLFLCKSDGFWVRISLTDVAQLSEGGTGASVATTAGGIIRMNAAGTGFENSGFTIGQSLLTTSNVTFGGVVAGPYVATPVSPTTLAANTNNYNASSTNTFQRISASAAYNITGIIATSSGAIRTYVNVGSFAITFTHEDAASTAANRILSSTGANLVCNANGGSITFIYDGTSARWRDIALR